MLEEIEHILKWFYGDLEKILPKSDIGKIL